MNQPPILSEVLRHLSNPTHQETAMADTLHAAIHQAITDAVDAAVEDILGRYLTPRNLVNAAADAMNAPVQPTLPPATTDSAPITEPTP